MFDEDFKAQRYQDFEDRMKAILLAQYKYGDVFSDILPPQKTPLQRFTEDVWDNDDSQA